MTPKTMKVLEMCIENGIKLGLNRAYKHDEHPDRDTIERYISSSITDEIYEWFDVEISE